MSELVVKKFIIVELLKLNQLILKSFFSEIYDSLRRHLAMRNLLLSIWWLRSPSTACKNFISMSRMNIHNSFLLLLSLLLLILFILSKFNVTFKFFSTVCSCEMCPFTRLLLSDANRTFDTWSVWFEIWSGFHELWGCFKLVMTFIIDGILLTVSFLDDLRPIISLTDFNVADLSSLFH